MTTLNCSFELLLIDEYAERLKVGKSTIYQWKALGILKPGKHFFQVGKTIRYLWSLDHIMELNSEPLNDAMYARFIAEQRLGLIR